MRAGHVSPGVFALVQGVVPVLHARLLSERLIREPGVVAGGVDVRMRGLEILVDDDAVARGQAGPFGQRDGGFDAHADNHQVGLDSLAAVGLDDESRALSLKGRRLLAFEDSDAPTLKETLHGQSQVLRKHPVAEMGRRVDHGDLQLVDAEGGGHFRSDEPAADDHRRLAFRSLASDALIVVEDSVVADSVQVSAGNREDLRRAAGRQEQFLEPVRLPLAVVDRFALRVQRHNAPARK